MNTDQELIESAFEQRDSVSVSELRESCAAAVERALDQLESGEQRVAEPDGEGGWRVNAWLKKAVLLYFRLQPTRTVIGAGTNWFDKVPLRFEGYDDGDFQKLGARIVPQALVRRGAHIGRNVVLMPSYVNIGARVGEGSMIDTWATVGSCAQIGSNVHISGGAGIGGVLEPLQAAPTIIEDDCFIGARSEVVEGVIVERGAVIGMGVFLGQSTRIFHRERDEVLYGRVPAGSVVVPGTLPSSDGRYSLACAVIVKQVDARTRAKVGVNELLRGVHQS